MVQQNKDQKHKWSAKNCNYILFISHHMSVNHVIDNEESKAEYISPYEILQLLYTLDRQYGIPEMKMYLQHM